MDRPGFEEASTLDRLEPPQTRGRSHGVHGLFETKEDRSREDYSQSGLLGFKIERTSNEQPVETGLVPECR